MDKKTQAPKRKRSWRHGFQALWALLTNSYLVGFAQGKIYQGKGKTLCVPGLNCYSCPGAVYSLFNPVSLVRYRVDADACVSCGKCAKVCGMGCDPVKQANDPECIRCGDCKRACPTQAIHSGCRK